MINEAKEKVKKAIKELIKYYDYDIIKINIDYKKSVDNIELKVIGEDKL